MPKTSVEILAEHAAATLPDSMAQRRVVLSAIRMHLKKSSAAYVNIKAQLASLDDAERLQANLPLIFKGDGKGAGR